MYAATSELAVLCKMLAEEYPGAYYAPHHRGYGVNALGNYDEMLQLGRVTGCPVRRYRSSKMSCSLLSSRPHARYTQLF